MRALLFFFLVAVSACAAQKVQTLPAVKPADGHVTDESAHEPSAGKEGAQQGPAVYPDWSGVWGLFQPADRHQRPSPGFSQGFFPGINQGIYPGFFPGQFPGFPQYPFPGFGR